MSITVDGFVAGPKGEIDWIFRRPDESAKAWTVENIWQAGVHIMGSRTYYDMAAYWPFSTEVFAAPMNEIPKVIFSRGAWCNSASSTSIACWFTQSRLGKGSLCSARYPRRSI